METKMAREQIDWKQYDNIMFDLYGTLIDLSVDEQSPKTWKRWCRVLDQEGFCHPPYYVLRRDFFQRDRRDRQLALERGEFQFPEIDVLPIYREMLLMYGNAEPSREQLLRLSYSFRKASVGYIRLYPGVKEFLKVRRAEGKKLYLLSNAQASYTNPEISCFGLEELLDGIILSSDRLCMKPDTDFYSMMFDEYHLDCSRTVMIGDSFTNDVEGAIRAGIQGIHLSGENCAKVFYLNNL